MNATTIAEKTIEALTIVDNSEFPEIAARAHHQDMIEGLVHGLTHDAIKSAKTEEEIQAIWTVRDEAMAIVMHNWSIAV